MNATPKTYDLGILGWPVGHSRSPSMHLAAAKALGLSLNYRAIAVPPNDLTALFEGKNALPADGFNVTVPHKQAVIELLDRLDESARQVGAVNTVVTQADALVGHNTDARGLANALQESSVQLKNKKVSIVGAGGAARAAAIAVSQLGAETISIVTRDATKAHALVASLRSHCQSAMHVAALDSETWANDCALLIQATSATLGDTSKAKMFADAWPWKNVPRGCVVLDLVYEPLQTAVLQSAEKRGLRTLDGLGMLVHQGALAFELWTGKKAPLDVMRRAASS